MMPISPLDGRYAAQVDAQRPYCTEEALFRARCAVEIQWLFVCLGKKLKSKQRAAMEQIVEKFSAKDAEAIRAFEKITRHDVKAVEYFLRTKLEKIPGGKEHLPFLHFALTSEDVNNLAYGILVHGALKNVLIPSLQSISKDLQRLAKRWNTTTLLSLTHGQPATPTTVGKELQVFVDRLDRQLMQLKGFRMQGKFGGAVATYAAHKAAYPEIDWEKLGKTFVKSLGLTPLAHATQINPHDDVAELSHMLVRISTILLDCSRDHWLYIMRGVFKQRVVRGEVGSSTMPHKVNPIDFENAEGNLGLGIALFHHFAEKLPVSRLQRDLSDSTVLRNVGVAFGYLLLAVRSLERGLSRIDLNRSAVARELEDHPEVHAEAIQMVLRRHGVSDAYEQLKKLTRGEKITLKQLTEFVEQLELPKGEKARLKQMLQ